MRALRRQTGNAITETGPMLYVFFILIFFPLLDVLGIAAQYGAGWYLNHAVTRELACSRAQTADGGPVADAVENDFMHTGIGAFVGINTITQQVAYPPQASSADPPTVRCTTIINAKPFIYVPLPFPVPGLNAPMDLQFTNVRPREDTR